MKIFFAAAFLLLIFGLFTFIDAAAGDGSINYNDQPFQPTITFVHRHGARTPQGIVNDMASCQYPLCQLTKAGLAMCTSAGEYLMQNFVEPLTGVTDYDVKRFQTVSTDTKRTVLSAEAVLGGAFTQNEQMAPFVDFIPASLDYNMSFWSSWPHYFMGDSRGDRFGTFVIDYVNAHFSQNLLDQFGQAMSAQKICSTSAIDCLALAADFLDCNLTNGDPIASILTNNAGKIYAYKAVFFAKMMGYNASDELSTQPGSWGYNFALQMTHAMNYSLGPISNDNENTDVDRWPLRVFHFSAHDWTLFPLYSAFGFWEPEMMFDTAWIPVFADTLLLHTVPPQNPSDNYTNPGVKAFRFFPRQVRSSPEDPVDMPATFPVEGHVEIGLRCSDSAGNFLRFSNESDFGCSVQELINTVNRVKPQSALGGMCYVSFENANVTGCLFDDAPTPGSSCQRYRAVCDHLPCAVPPNETNSSQFKCPKTGKFYKISDPARGFACTNTRPGWKFEVNSHVDAASGELVADLEEYPVATAAGLVIGGLVVGVASGFFVFLWAKKKMFPTE